MSRESLKRKLPFVCADARHLPFKKQYDCILFLYDGINYFDSIDNYEKFFHQAAQCLKPGGLLLFDITTEYNSFQHFYDYLDFDEFSDCSVVRHSYYDEITTTQHNNFTIFTIDKKNPNLYKKYIEKHEQKVLPPQLIEETIPNSLYKILGIWDEFKMHRYTSRSERVHFLLQKNN
jgi:SAM-dependent methyltransferase